MLQPVKAWLVAVCRQNLLSMQGMQQGAHRLARHIGQLPGGLYFFQASRHAVMEAVLAGRPRSSLHDVCMTCVMADWAELVEAWTI